MANRYWVGGTANWDATAGTKWSTTSGGAGGAAVPTSADDVYFNAASGAGTCTVTATSSCLNLVFTGYTGTFDGSSTLSIYGSLTLVAGMTYTKSSLNFTGAGSGRTIIPAGKTFAGTTNFALSTGGSVGLSGNFDGAGISLSSGTFSTNNYQIDLTAAFATSSSTAKTLNLGSSVINVGTSCNIGVGTNLTLNAGTSHITNISTSWSFQGGGHTYYDVTLGGGSNTRVVWGANTFHNLTIQAGTTQVAQIGIDDNQTVTGTFTFDGGSTTNRTLLSPYNIEGTPYTITAAATSIGNYADLQDITGAGAASWNLTGATVGDCGGNSGITFPTPISCYWVHGASATYNYSDAYWFTTSGGATPARVPLPQDTAVIDANSFSIGSRGITMNVNRIGSVNTSGTTYGHTLYWTTVISTFGNLTLDALTLGSGSSVVTMAGRGSHTLNFAATNAMTNSMVVKCVTGTYTLQSDIRPDNSSLTLTSGTFDAATYNITTQLVAVTGALSRTLNMGSGTWSCSIASASTSFFNVTGSNYTINCGTSTIFQNSTSATAKNFTGGGATYYKLLLSGAASIGACAIKDSNTFNEIEVPPNGYVKITSGTTQTVNLFTAVGTAGNTIKLESSTPGTPGTMTKPSGTVDCDYLIIQDSTVTGGATWNAGANSSDISGNSGWTFSGGGATNSPIIIIG